MVNFPSHIRCFSITVFIHYIIIWITPIQIPMLYGCVCFLHYNHLQATLRLACKKYLRLLEFIHAANLPAFLWLPGHLPFRIAGSSLTMAKGEYPGEWQKKREPQLCIRKKYFMAFFVKRFYSLRISETGKDIFDGKKEKAERNPL